MDKKDHFGVCQHCDAEETLTWNEGFGEFVCYDCAGIEQVIFGPIFDFGGWAGDYD